MIPINRPLISEEERVEVMRVLHSGRLTDSSLEGGFMVKEFEKTFANFVGVKYAVAVNSGTSALLASLLSLNVGYGDEVLMPSFNFVATANAVLITGARPVFVDIDLNDYTIDIKDLERKINKRCKAVIPVHLYGHPANMDPIIELAREHDLVILEDAAQSLGASYKGRQTGAIGDLSCFSFYPTKVITSGEGGAITTDDEDLFVKLKMVRNHGIVSDYNSEVLGLNLRMPEIGAALIKAQMKRIKTFLEVRRKNAEMLSESLDGLQGIKLPREKESCVHNWYLYTIFVEKNRDEVLESLNKRGIGATAYYKIPVHRTHLYTRLGYSNLSLPNTILASEHVLSLPVHPGITEQDLSVITSSIREVIKTNF
ncbi:MAG: DegT/DnrJ/EryC1/StrS family aminotransferase [Candidatus Methylarchaceae archaeon HK02M1]|nr:DegT/DnrJ/EryC1/StrS family aminotransferase [Candidatus Methylarchaceae archaeon HK02M1]